MTFQPGGRRSILQRRSSTSNTIQAALDGVAVLGVSWWLIDYHIGVLTSAYVIMLLLLVGSLAVVYDHYAIYRSNASLTLKAFRLFKAWTATFAFLVAMAFLTKQSEQYSRLLVAQIYVLGFFAQLILHVVMREVQKKLSAQVTQSENALIIGSGRLANFLNRKITDNPWIGERVVGCVLIKDSDDPVAMLPGEPRQLSVLGGIADLDELMTLD